MSGQISESLVMQIEVQIQQALKNLGIVNKTVKDATDKQLTEAKRLFNERSKLFKAEIKAKEDAQRQLAKLDKENSGSRAVDANLRNQIKSQESAWKRMAEAKRMEAKDIADIEKLKARSLADSDKANQKEIANARVLFNERAKQLKENLAIQAQAQKQLDALKVKADAKAMADAKNAPRWQDQILNMNKLNPLINQHSKVFVAGENAKQKAIEATIKAQQRANQQQNSKQAGAMSRMTNAILPGFGAGIGAGGALGAISAITSAVQGLGQAMRQGIDFNAYLEANTAMFKVILKDGPASVKLLGDLQKEALKTSLNFKESVNSSKQLLAYGFQVKQIIPTMRMLGTVTSATGGSLDDLAYVYGTLRTQGRAYTRDLMQFAMRGIPIYENLAQVMGVNVDQIKAMTEAGQVGFAEVEQAFQRMTGEGGIYAGAMEARMQTFIGMTETLEKKTEILLGKSAKLFEGISKGVVSSITWAVDVLSETMTRYQYIVDKVSGEENRRGITADIQNAPTGDAGVRTRQGALDAYVDQDFGLNVMRVMFAQAGKAGQTMILDMKAGLNVVAEFTRKTGASQREVAEVLWRRGVITKDVWASISSEAELTAKFMSSAFKKVTSDLMLLSGKLGVAVGSVSDKSGIDYVAQFQGFRGTIGRTDVQSQRDKTNARITQARGLGVPEEIIKQIADEFNNALSERITTGLGELNSSAYSSKQKAEIEIYLKNLADFMIEEPTKGGGSKEGKAVQFSPDPRLYEKMLAEGSFTEIDNIQFEYVDAMSNLTKAYLDAGITGEKLTQAQNLLTAQTNIKIAEAQARSSGTIGSNSAIISAQGEASALWAKVRDVETQLDIARNNAPNNSSTINNPNAPIAIRTSLIQQEQAQEEALKNAQLALESLSFEANLASEKLSQLQAIKMSDFQTLTMSDLRAKIAGVGNDGAGSQITMTQSAHALEMENKRIEHETVLEMARASAMAGDAKAELDIKYMVDKYNLEVDLATKLNAEQIKQIQRQSDLKDYDIALGGDPKYWEDLKIKAVNAFKSGNNGQGVGAMAKGALQGTDAGMFMGGGNPWMILISALLKATMSLESVQKLLGSFTGMLEKAVKGAEPLINSMNEVFINLFDMLGDILGPIISVLSLLNSILTPFVYMVLAPIIASMQMMSEVFTIFADFVIEKVINPIIDFVNGFIVMINTVFGWLGVNIKLLSHVMTSSAQAMADAEKELQKIKLKEYGDALSTAIDYLRNRIIEQADKMIQSAQDLFDVGAVDAQQYETMYNNASDIKHQVDPAYLLMAQYFPQVLDQGLTLDQMLTMYHDLLAQEKAWSKKNEEEQLIALKNIEANTYAYLSPAQQETANRQQAEALQMIAGIQAYVADVADGDYTATAGSAQATADAFASGDIIAGVWEAGATVTNAIVETVGNVVGWIGGLFGFASGTANIPHDMIANVHKGEGIVPATFMDSIRSGDLTLSGENGTSSGSGDTYVTVVVQGSVTSERDLATNIATIINKQRRVGALTQ